MPSTALLLVAAMAETVVLLVPVVPVCDVGHDSVLGDIVVAPHSLVLGSDSVLDSIMAGWFQTNKNAATQPCSCYANLVDTGIEFASVEQHTGVVPSFVVLPRFPRGSFELPLFCL